MTTTDSLTQAELALISKLASDVKWAYLEAGVIPENRADCEAIRKGIRDRLKTYITGHTALGNLMERAVRALEGLPR